MESGGGSGGGGSGGGGNGIDLFSKTATAMLLTTLPVSSLIMAHNISAWRSHRTAAWQKRPVLLFTSALALMAAFTATLGFVTPRRGVPLYAPTDHGMPFAFETFALSPAAVGVAAVLFGAAALGMDGVFTLHLYCLAYKLEYGQELPRWKVRGAGLVSFGCVGGGEVAKADVHAHTNTLLLSPRYRTERNDRCGPRTSTPGSCLSPRGSSCSRRRRYLRRRRPPAVPKDVRMYEPLHAHRPPILQHPIRSCSGRTIH